MRYGLTIFNYDALEADELWGVVWWRYTYLDHSLSLSAQVLKVERWCMPLVGEAATEVALVEHATAVG